MNQSLLSNHGSQDSVAYECVDYADNEERVIKSLSSTLQSESNNPSKKKDRDKNCNESSNYYFGPRITFGLGRYVTFVRS